MIDTSQFGPQEITLLGSSQVFAWLESRTWIVSGCGRPPPVVDPEVGFGSGGTWACV